MIGLKIVWGFRLLFFFSLLSTIFVLGVTPIRSPYYNFIEHFVLFILLVNILFEGWLLFKTKKVRAAYRLIQKFNAYSEQEVTDLLKNQNFSEQESTMAWDFFNQRFIFGFSVPALLIVFVSTIFLGWAVSEVLFSAVIFLVYLFFLLLLSLFDIKGFNSLGWVVQIGMFFLLFFLLIGATVLWYFILLYCSLLVVTFVLFFRRKNTNFFLLQTRLLLSTVIGLAIVVALYILSSYVIHYISGFFLYALLIYASIYLALLGAHSMYKYASKF